MKLILHAMMLATASAASAVVCSAATFPLDLGDTHCEGFPLARNNVNSSSGCLAACCAAGDACETWQWCEEGHSCTQGYWSQSGTYGAGSDLDGWPQNTTVAVAEAACSASPACVGLTYKSPDLHPAAATLHIYLKNSSTGPMPDAIWSRHVKARAGCAIGKLGSSCRNSSATGWSSHAMAPRPDGPCDIFAAAGTPCVAAHSVVRTLYVNYSGPLYRVLRDSDHAGLDIGAHHNGFAKTAAQDTFCEGTACYILRIFDQSPHRNHLDTSPAGGYCPKPLSPVNASRDPITVSGNAGYGAYFEGDMGYRIDATDGVAVGDGEQTIYMVTRGDHVNAGCCFDYGNAETDNNDDGKGTMAALYFGNSSAWSRGKGQGPWVMADLENGLWAGASRASPAPSIAFKWVTAMTKGKKGGFALKGGNAQAGSLQKLWEGQRPVGYEVMKKQGAIILGIGGDNSCSAIGTFYEGAMTASYTTDATDAALQANIVAAGYGQ